MYNKVIAIIVMVLSFAIGYSQQDSPQWQWARVFGSGAEEFAGDIDQDSKGNIYNLMRYEGNRAIIDGDTLYNSSGTSTIVLIKMNAAGNILWKKQPVGLESYGSAVAIDRHDNIYVAGYFRSNTLKFGSTVLTQSTNIEPGDMFLARYDSLGNEIWARSWGDSLTDRINSLTIDTAGDVYISGSFNSYKIMFDTTKLVNSTNANHQEGFLAKVNPNGNVLWAKKFGNKGNEYITDMIADKDTSIYITGYFNSALPNTGNDTIFPYSQIHKMFLLKYSKSGSLIWGQNAGGNAAGGHVKDVAQCITLDIYGNPIISGTLDSDTAFFESTLAVNVNDANSRMFIAKYHKMLARPVWVQSYDYLNPVRIESDILNNLYLIANHGPQATNIGPLTLSPFAASNITIVKLDSSATPRWVKEVTNCIAFGQAISVSKNGNTIYALGTTDLDPIIDSTLIPDGSLRNVFIGKISQYNSTSIFTTGGDIRKPDCHGFNPNLGRIIAYTFGGFPPYTYQWSTGATTGTVTNIMPGIYTLTVYDSHNASVLQTYTVTGDTLPHVSLEFDTDTICLGEVEQVTANINGTGPFTFAWVYNGQTYTTSSINVNLGGPFTLTIADVNGCKASDADTIQLLLNCTEVGLNDINPNTNLILYPNPTKGTFSISGNGQLIENISIYNFTGQLVQQIIGPPENKFNIQELSQGLYTVKAVINGKSNYLRLFKE